MKALHTQRNERRDKEAHACNYSSRHDLEVMQSEVDEAGHEAVHEALY